MRRFWITTGILVVNLILQSTLFQYIQVSSIKPNTCLLIVISFAILRGDLEGAIVGFFGGLLQDIFFGRFIGINALLFMLVGYFCGKPFKDFYRENYLLPILMAAISSFLFDLCFYVTNYFFRAKLDIGFYLAKIIFPAMIYNILLSVPIYIFIYTLNNKIELEERAKKSIF